MYFLQMLVSGNWVDVNAGVGLNNLTDAQSVWCSVTLRMTPELAANYRLVERSDRVVPSHS